MRKPLLAQLLVAGVFLLAAPILGAAESTASTGPAEVVRRWNDALNRHDPDAVLALTAADAAVQVDREPQHPEQVRGWIEQLIREDVHVDLVGAPRINLGSMVRYPSGSTIAWRARLSLDRYRQSSLQWVDAELDAVVVDSRITFVSLRPDPSWFGQVRTPRFKTSLN